MGLSHETGKVVDRVDVDGEALILFWRDEPFPAVVCSSRFPGWLGDANAEACVFVIGEKEPTWVLAGRTGPGFAPEGTARVRVKSENSDAAVDTLVSSAWLLPLPSNIDWDGSVLSYWDENETCLLRGNPGELGVLKPQSDQASPGGADFSGYAPIETQ